MAVRMTLKQKVKYVMDKLEELYRDYEFLRSNIKEKFNCRNSLYEIAVNLSIGGTVASKKIFFEHVVNITNNMEYISIFNEINSKYFKLRILIIKLSFTSAKRDLENVINKIIEIEEYETKILDSIVI